MTAKFTEFFLQACIDQVTFMEQLARKIAPGNFVEAEGTPLLLYDIDTGSAEHLQHAANLCGCQGSAEIIGNLSDHALEGDETDRVTFDMGDSQTVQPEKGTLILST